MEANALYTERKLPLECKTVWSRWQKPLALNFPFFAKYLSKISVKLPALSLPKELTGCAKAMYRIHQALTGNTEKSAS